MATKGSQLDSASVTIDGVVYSLKEPPSPDSDIVLREKKDLERQLDSQRIVEIPKMIAGYVRMARYAVTGDAELERGVDKRLTDVVLALHESYIDLYDVAGDVFLSQLVDSVVFLFVGEESLAWDRFGKARKSQKQIERSVTSRMDSLQYLSRSCEETVKNIERCILMAIWKCKQDADTHYTSAEHALKGILVTILHYRSFWETVLVNLGQYFLLKKLEGMREKGEKKCCLMNSPTFKKEILTYYARWVALQQICTSFHARFKSEERNLLSSLAARPSSVEEARKELPKMGEDMDKMLQKRHEELMKNAMQDADDDFC